MKTMQKFLPFILFATFGCGSHHTSAGTNIKGTPEEGDTVTAALRAKFASATPITRDEKITPFVGVQLTCISHDARSYSEPDAGVNDKRYTRTLAAAGGGFYYWDWSSTSLLSIDPGVGLSYSYSGNRECIEGTATEVYRITQDGAIIAETNQTRWRNTCNSNDAGYRGTSSVSYPGVNAVAYEICTGNR